MDTDGDIFNQEQVNKSASKQAYRMFSEGVPCNKKIYSESEITAKVLNNTKFLRDQRVKFYYERVPDERIDEFAETRRIDEDRSQKKVNFRFPELSAAREAYLGKEKPQAQNKKRDVQEVCKFSEVVEKLAREEEPHPARLHFA